MQITNRTVTAEDVMALKHCYKPERINGLMPRPMTLLAILDLDTIPAEDRIWDVLRLIESPQERCAVSAAIVRRTPLADGRTVWDLLSDERSRAGVSAAEAYSRGEASEAGLRVSCAAAHAAARAAANSAARAAARAATNSAYASYAAAEAAAYAAAVYVAKAAYASYASYAAATANTYVAATDAVTNATYAAQVAILREMLGAA